MDGLTYTGFLAVPESLLFPQADSSDKKQNNTR